MLNSTLKYAVTGHTQGIGRGLFYRLSPNVLGFSKSTGYDISIPNIRRKIAKELTATKCDVFINCAHHHFSQSMMFIEVLKEWHDDNDKTIINIGSNVADVSLLPKSFDILEYQMSKVSLKAIMNHLDNVKCKVLYKSFGYVGTPAIIKKYPHFTYKDYISIDDACDIILS